MANQSYVAPPLDPIKLIWAQRHFETKQRRDDYRSPYQRDKARILHSAAFRRLQSKTQVLGVGMNDFYRTRLTHSLEVAQIGTGIRAQLKRKYPDAYYLFDSSSLIDALSLAHDIGHPPFGHGGEMALNQMMQGHGGFEGNGQTFRILTLLEPYTAEHGMNLTRRTLLGVLKYPVLASVLQSPTETEHTKRHPIKAIYDQDKPLLDWVLSPLSVSDRQLFADFIPAQDGQHGRSKYKSLDATIMELADDIAYAVHDLEDAIVMGMIHFDQWQAEIRPILALSESPWLSEQTDSLGEALFRQDPYHRKDAIGSLVNGLVTAIHLTQDQSFTDPLLQYQAKMSAPYQVFLDTLKRLVFSHVVQKPEVQMLEYKGQQILIKLFEAFANEPMRLLPLAERTRYQQALEQQENTMRVICDYLASMTDDYALKIYQQLFSPSFHASFARLHENLG